MYHTRQTFLACYPAVSQPKSATGMAAEQHGGGAVVRVRVEVAGELVTQQLATSGLHRTW